MTVGLIVYLLGIVAIGAWTLIEMRHENAVGRMLLAVIGVSCALVWPLLLVCVIVVVLYWLVELVREIEQ